MAGDSVEAGWGVWGVQQVSFPVIPASAGIQNDKNDWIATALCASQ